VATLLWQIQRQIQVVPKYIRVTSACGFFFVVVHPDFNSAVQLGFFFFCVRRRFASISSLGTSKTLLVCIRSEAATSHHTVCY
jgi:hypothetical protein